MRWVLLALALAFAWWFWPQQNDSWSSMPHPTPDPPAGSVPGVLAPGSQAAEAPAPTPRPASDARTANASLPAFLPAEAHRTIALILRGGPYPHRQDGGTFSNREGHLPRKPRGWYREFTVETPGLRHRGARRIVTGGDPPAAWYYTDDHYDSFRSFQVPEDMQ